MKLLKKYLKNSLEKTQTKIFQLNEVPAYASKSDKLIRNVHS